MKTSKKMLLLAAAAGGVLTYLYRYEIEETVRSIQERLSADADDLFDGDDYDDDCIIHRDPVEVEDEEEAAADTSDIDDTDATEDDFADEEPEKKD